MTGLGRRFTHSTTIWKTHTEAVMEWTGKFRECLRSLIVTAREQEVLRAAAYLHDIGKVLPTKHPGLRDIAAPSHLHAPMLENVHHILTFLLLDDVIANRDIPRDDQGILRPFTEQNPRGKRLREYLNCIAWLSLLHKPLRDEQLLEFSEALCGVDSNQADFHRYWIDPTGLRQGSERFDERRRDAIKRLDDWLLKEAGKTKGRRRPSGKPVRDPLRVAQPRRQARYLAEPIAQEKFMLAVLLDDLGIRE